MKAWGYAYVTNMTWDKVLLGLGYWSRVTHEHLLIGVRGKKIHPSKGSLRSSIFRSKRGKHSKKPEIVAEWIEDAYPEAKKIELFARQQRNGWAAWGNELRQGRML